MRVTANDGSIGLGNIDPLSGYSAESNEQSLTALRERVCAVVQGLDAGNPHQIVEVMDTALPGVLDAKASIEMACVDLTS